MIALATALLLSGSAIVVQVGAHRTQPVSFPIGGGENSNPSVLKVTTDTAHQRLVFTGKAPGRANYTVVDARAPSHMLTFEVKVVPPPPPSPSPTPSAMASPSATPTPSATASEAGSKE